MIDPWTGETRNRDLNLLDATLHEVLERVTEGRLAAFEVVKSVWGDVVAEPWSERARPVRLEKGVLTVEVSDGGTASRLRLEQAKVKQALNDNLGRGEIAQIKLKVGRSNPRRRQS